MNNGPFFKDIDAGVASVDAGLRAHMQRVYNYMGCGLAATGAVAYLASTSIELMRFMFGNPIMALIVAILPLIAGITLSWRINKIDSSTAQMIFWAFAGLMGLSLSSVFMVYTGSSIASTFFVTSAMFLSMSIYGYVTNSDLSKMGSILMMGVIGLVIAGLVNMFLKNHMFHMVISFLGVIIFTGLTAYDTQKIKNYYLESDSAEIANKKAIIGALGLYLDFVNMFLYLIQLIGVRKE